MSIQLHDPHDLVPLEGKTALVAGLRGRTPVVTPAVRLRSGWKPLVPQVKPDKILRWAHLPEPPPVVFIEHVRTAYERRLANTARSPNRFYDSWLGRVAEQARS